MERLNKERKPLRISFTRLCTLRERTLGSEEGENQKEVFWRNLLDKYSRLEEVQDKIFIQLLENNVSEEEYEKEFEAAEEYRERFINLRVKLDFKDVIVEPPNLRNRLIIFLLFLSIMINLMNDVNLNCRRLN